MTNGMVHEHTKKGVNPLMAGAVGVVIGAVGTMVAVKLSDEQTRKKIGEKLTMVRDHFSQKTQPMMRKVQHSIGRMTGKEQRSMEKENNKEDKRKDDIKIKAG
jgi:ribosomal protein L21E